MRHTLALLLTLLTTMAHATPTITVSCPDTVRVNSMFLYKVTLTALSYKSSKGLTFGPGMEVVNYHYDQGKTTVNGKVYNTLTLSYSLRISTMGAHRLPQVSIEAEGKKMVSQSTTVVVMPGAQLEQEYNTAFSLLTRHGVDAANLHLSLEECGRNIALFSDYITGCFAAVATQKYARLMGNDGVLAWSTEGAMRSLKEGGPDWIFKSYGQQLDALAAGKAQPYRGNSHNVNVKPLLDGVAWGQDEPYNRFCPNVAGKSGKNSAVAGCGPVALGQVMMYHKYPAHGNGKRAYNVGTTQYSLNLSQQTFDWSKMRKQYDSAEADTAVITHIARLIVSAGVATGADFGKERTSTSASLYRSALVNNFGYSASAHSMTGGRPEDHIRVAIAELRAARPMVVAGGSHAFVLDGMQDDFMHYNMGWSGLANGWYRTLITTDGNLAFEMMVAGITPGTKDTKHRKSVNVSKPGTLTSMLTANEVVNTTHLTISGKLNNADIRLLRRMAGAVEDTSWNEVRGCLTNLDLRQVKFVTDNDSAFLRFPAQGYKAWHVVTSSYTQNGTVVPNSTRTQREDFDFSHMTHDKWKRFKALGLHKKDGYYLSEEADGYYINCHTESGQVSYCMWKDCENLREVLLPDNIKAIGDRAFVNCTSLLHLDIPSKCKLLGREVFAYCIAIESVTYTRLEETPSENFRNAMYKANLLTPNLTKRRE